MDIQALTEFISTHWDNIKTALLILSPFLSSILTWDVAHKRLSAEAEQREEMRRIEAAQRDENRRVSLQEQIEGQRQRLHAETIEQTRTLSEQFKTIMSASEARNNDLRAEVTQLRAEVISLRKALDRQRLLCADCPKFPTLAYGETNGHDQP